MIYIIELDMELYLPAERPQRNPTNGQFLAGHKSLTKGIPRTKWMGKAKDQRLRKEAAKRFREQKHPENAGVPKRRVVMVTDKGKFFLFNSICDAAKAVGLEPGNIGRCCRQNAARKVKQRTWTKFTKKEEGNKVNTDHRYKGVRWYFEDDNIWTTKIKDNG